MQQEDIYKPGFDARVDWGNQLTRGLSEAYLFNERGGVSLHPLGRMEGTSAEVNLSATHTEFRDGGLELNNNTSVLGRSNLGNLTTIGSGDFTVMVRWTPLRQFSQTETSVIGSWNTGGSPGTNQWLIGSNYAASSTDYRYYFSVEIGSTSYTAYNGSAPQWSVGVTDTITGVRRGGSVVYYRDNELLGSTTGATGTVNSGTGYPVRLGGIGAGAYLNSYALYYFAFLWKRALTKSEIMRLHVDPYQMFTSPSAPVAAVPAVGGVSIPVFNKHFRDQFQQ